MFICLHTLYHMIYKENNLTHFLYNQFDANSFFHLNRFHKSESSQKFVFFACLLDSRIDNLFDLIIMTFRVTCLISLARAYLVRCEFSQLNVDFSSNVLLYILIVSRRRDTISTRFNARQNKMPASAFQFPDRHKSQ